MIIQDNSSKLHYLHFLRQKVLVKTGKRLYNLLQIYNNKLVDKKVNDYHQTKLDDYESNYDPFREENVYNMIYRLNHPKTVRDFQRVIESPLTSTESSHKVLTRLSADNTNKVISKLETKKVLENLRYVEKTLESAKINIKEYNKLTRKLPSHASRQSILEKTLTSGRMYNGRELSYKQLNNLSKDLERHKQNLIDHKLVEDINNETRKNGEGNYYTHKVWIWSGLENTRHSNMDEETVGVDEKFRVTNEVTGETDELLYPGDLENYENPSNIINCACTLEYIKQ